MLLKILMRANLIELETAAEHVDAFNVNASLSQCCEPISFTPITVTRAFEQSLKVFFFFSICGS